MPLIIRPAEDTDIPAMAEIRAAERGDTAFWAERITGYCRGVHSPQHALAERAVFVADDEAQLAGFVAGHRTRRFDCDGELQWINVAAHRRGKGIADALMERIAAWFVAQDAHRICVNVDPQNTVARRLYSRWGARPLNEHWMVWDAARLMILAASDDGA
jgi:GNAT superfamily N-acetyltransferase